MLEDAETTTARLVSGERAWVSTLVPKLMSSVAACSTKKVETEVCDGYRLPYASEVLEYDHDDALDTHYAGYQTDLLVYDQTRHTKRWVPRVVIECKLGGVTTHDALTYSAKAATHKHVHPYLRYGILIGALGDRLPARLIRHGAHFDFMLVWKGKQPTASEWKALTSILCSEVESSRDLHRILCTRGHRQLKVTRVHRPLVLEKFQR